MIRNLATFMFCIVSLCFEVQLSHLLFLNYQALLLEVCDETEVAELKLKVNFHTLGCCMNIYIFTALSYLKTGYMLLFDRLEILKCM